MELGELNAGVMQRALKVFLARAYSNGAVPENRQHFQNIQDNMSLSEVFCQKFVEKLPPAPGGASKGYAMRVGCEWYPHLKMTVQPYAESPGYVFGVDTHDKFDLPVDHPEREQLLLMRKRNEALAKEINQDWDEADVATQHGLLRKYLRRSRESSAGTAISNEGK